MEIKAAIRHRAAVPFVFFVLGAILAALAIAIASDDEKGLDVGRTFDADVVSYFDASGPEPNVICFDRGDGDCGRPLFADETAPDIDPGDRVRATEVWLWHDGSARLAYYVEPLE